MATPRASSEPKPAEEAKTPEQDKAKKEEERKVKAKAAVKAACDELHAMRPQPRGDEIEAVLDQIRNMGDPPADAEAAKSTAKQLYDKSHPASEASKPVGSQSGEATTSSAPAA
jgi:hypothetical protein